jgi:hypothetical protein
LNVSPQRCTVSRSAPPNSGGYGFLRDLQRCNRCRSTICESTTLAGGEEPALPLTRYRSRDQNPVRAGGVSGARFGAIQEVLCASPRPLELLEAAHPSPRNIPRHRARGSGQPWNSAISGCFVSLKRRALRRRQGRSWRKAGAAGVEIGIRVTSPNT